jgi:hypothetical protein
MYSQNSSNFLTAALLASVLSLFWLPAAWAYKVEKICEDIPATSSAPAMKKCKLVKVQEGGAAKAGDAKGDAKAEGHGEAKKDAKPAGGH